MRGATARVSAALEMGQVVVFSGHHPMASRREARDSQVISLQSRLTAKPTKAGQRAGGIPRRRQVDTVVSSTPKAAAIALLPPSLFIASSLVMRSILVGEPPTCQVLDEFQLTNLSLCVLLWNMAGDQKSVAGRLLRTTLALGYDKAGDFAKAVGIDKGDYSNYESGKKSLPFSAARKIKRRFGISLDWKMDGDLHTLQRDLAEKILNLKNVA